MSSGNHSSHNKSAIDNILDFIFPPTCIGCGATGSYLCPSCRKLLKAHPEICPITHKDSTGYRVRQDLLTRESPLEGIIVLFRFEPLIKKLITQLKYNHRADIANFLGDRLALALQSHDTLSQLIIDNSKFIISYVPSHRRHRLFTRGYNQSKLLAQSTAKSLGMSKAVQLLYKTTHTRSQVGLHKSQRKANVHNSFSINQKINIPDKSTILIIDDVLTSGATLLEAAKTIKSFQPNCTIRGLTVARNG